MSNSSSPAPMYGAPQTPTPVPVPQAVTEECIVTSSYGSEQNRGYDPPSSASNHAPSQTGPPSTREHSGYPTQPHYSSPHSGYQQSPLYHPPGPVYHNPGPVVQVQFTQQHPQPQPQPGGHYQQVVHHLHPTHHHTSHNNHYQHHNQQHGMNNIQPQHNQHNQTPQHLKQASPQPSPQQYIQQPPQTPPHHQLPSNHPPPSQPISEAPAAQSQADPSLAPQTAPSPPQSMMQSRPQYYMAPGPRPSPQRFVTVRQSPGQAGTQVVQLVKPGQGVVGQHPQQQQRQFQLVQQPSQGSVRQVVIRQQQQQFGNVIRPGGGMRPAQQQPVRYVVRPPPQVVPVQLRPGGPVQQQMRMPPVHMVRPGPPRPGGSPSRQGVIQHTVQPHQYGAQAQARYGQGGPSPGMVRQSMSPGPETWRGGAGTAGQVAQGRMVRQPGPAPAGPGQVQQQPGGQRQFGGQQINNEKIAYNVEHVFIENGREVRKMPVEINGETIWVECVPGGGQGVPAGEGRQQQVQQDQEGSIMMDLGDSDSLEISGQGGAKAGKDKPTTISPGVAFSSQQKEAIIREVLDEHISPTDLAKKYNVSSNAIRDWIKKAGHSLPKSYKRNAKPPPGPASGGFSRMPDLPTAPLPPAQVGVAVGDPPTIDSPPLQEGGSVSTSISSPAGAGAGQYQGGPPAPKRVPGKLAMCKWCGDLSEDLSTCIRCRRKLPDDVKLLDDPAFKPKPDSTDHVAKKALRGVRLPSKNRRKANPDEPVCIALSSDEEGDDDNSRSSLVEAAEIGQEETGEGCLIPDANIVDGSHPGQWCSLPCRSIRIGNYKVLPKEKITITDKGVQIKVPAIINTTEVVTINIPMSDVLKVLAHFGKSMPLLFLYISPSACVRARRTLKMTNSQSFFLDVQSNDETQKRITILPEKLTEDNKAILKQHFGSNVQELESKDANEILVRSSPKDLPMLKSKMGGVTVGNIGDRRVGEQQVVKFCQYPPDGAGNVSVTNEDYNCLEAEQFLNDVIIDFYLKFLQHGRFSSIKEVMDRTHIFTTYFYKRLTTRPSNNNKVKAHPIEDNPNLSAAEKRYERVKKWTKKVNLFEKDFIVVPINEHAHWFVCVICFPGQSGCVRADDGVTPCDPPPGQARGRSRQKKKSVKKPLTIGSTTIIPLKGRQGDDSIRYHLEEEMSDRDEAEASDDDMEDELEEENGSKKVEEGVVAKTAVRQPCILTFDSLTGGSKARTHQTLREYLTCEWRAKMIPSGAEERVFSKDNMVGGCPKVQQQPNFSDCGIYLLQYVESFFRDPIGDYSLPIRSIMADRSIMEWFTKEEVELKRHNIAELIRKLAGEQNPGKEFNYPELNFKNQDDGEDSDDEDDEDYEGDQRPQQQNLIVGNSSLMRLSAGSNSSRLMVTPAKQGQGKVLIQRTGNQLKMSPYNSSGIPGVPAGVTVTPAPARLLAGNNISIRKMSVVSSSNNSSQHSISVGPSSSIGETVQTSPDSTSHEDSMGDSHLGDRDRRDDSQDTEQDRSSNVPDSQQGFESGASKRSAEMGGFDGGSKRVKSDSDT
eukprot:GFUD01017849.1.p1 GENE.GFUD01017849.1~~GFUD01017849.1.p1  ORF type:complete len:1547 (+),score=557.86 GFUD01017849.1:282-4922(+)